MPKVKKDIEGLEVEIEICEKFSNLMMINAVRNVVPVWKDGKLELYKKIFTSYQVTKLKNAHSKSSFFATLV